MHFFQFMLMLPRNLRPIKQFIYMHLKVYNIFFQKMVWLILFWATVHEILRINISTKCWIRRNLQNYSTIISWTVNHSKIKNIIFWNNRMQTFRWKSAKYLYFIKKLPILTGYHIFSRNLIPWGTKNYVLPLKVRRKKLLLHGLNV